MSMDEGEGTRELGDGKILNNKKPLNKVSKYFEK